LTWKVGINLVSESQGILLRVREKWCVSSKLHDWLLFIFVEKNENTHSVHVITKWWWKGVCVREEEPTKNYIKLVLSPQMGQGIMPNTVREFHFSKLSGNRSIVVMTVCLCLSVCVCRQKPMMHSTHRWWVLLQLAWRLSASLVSASTQGKRRFSPSRIARSVTGEWTMKVKLHTRRWHVVIMIEI